MALSANRQLRGKVLARRKDAVIKSSSVLYDGALACFDSNNNLVPADDSTAAYKWAGVVIRGGTGDGTLEGVVERRGTRWLPHSGTVTASMIGKLAYVVDDESVTDVAPSTSGGEDHVVGRIIDCDTTNDEVEVDLEDAAIRDTEWGGGIQVKMLESDELDHGDFTDGGGAAGSIDVGFDIPANSIVVGVEYDVTEAFDGDTSGIMALGDGSDADRFNGADDPSCYAIACVGSAGGGDGKLYTGASDVGTPTLTITGDADWGNVTAGKVIVRVYYIECKGTA